MSFSYLSNVTGQRTAHLVRRTLHPIVRLIIHLPLSMGRRAHTGVLSAGDADLAAL